MFVKKVLVRTVVIIAMFPLLLAVPKVQAGVTTPCTNTVDVPANAGAPFSWSGTWFVPTTATPQAMFGTLAMTTSNGAWVQYTVTCAQFMKTITIFNSQGPDRGSYQILIDNVNRGTYSLQAADYRRQAGRTFDVNPTLTQHTIKVIAILGTNQKLDVDSFAFDIEYSSGTTMYDVKDTIVRKVGSGITSWVEVSAPGTENQFHEKTTAGAFNNSYHTSTTPMDLIRLAFRGSPTASTVARMTAGFSRRPSGSGGIPIGSLGVTIDGTDFGVIDQFSYDLEFQNFQHYFLSHANSDIHIMTLSVLPPPPGFAQIQVEVDYIGQMDCWGDANCRGYAAFLSPANDKAFTAVQAHIVVPVNQSGVPINQAINDGGLISGVVWGGSSGTSVVEAGWRRRIGFNVSNNPYAYWQYYKVTGQLASIFSSNPITSQELINGNPFTNGAMDVWIQSTGFSTNVCDNVVGGTYDLWDVSINGVTVKTACLEHSNGSVAVGGEASWVSNPLRNDMNQTFSGVQYRKWQAPSTWVTWPGNGVDWLKGSFDTYGYCKSIVYNGGLISSFSVYKSPNLTCTGGN